MATVDQALGLLLCYVFSTDNTFIRSIVYFVALPVNGRLRSSWEVALFRIIDSLDHCPTRRPGHLTRRIRRYVLDGVVHVRPLKPESKTSTKVYHVLAIPCFIG
jgi:hypothetical protein